MGLKGLSLVVYLYLSIFLVGIPAYAQTVSAPVSAIPVQFDTLPLSLKDTVQKLLDNNISITVLEYDPRIQSQRILEERAVFDPSLSLEFTADERVSQIASAFASPNISKNQNLNWRAGLSQKLWTGLEYDLSFDNTRNKTNSNFAGLNPNYSSEVTLELTQPLLKNFGLDINKSNIYIALNDATISELDFKKNVIDIITNTANSYWDLVFSIEDLRVQEKSLERARDLERRVRAQVEVGTMAPLEILQAQSEVASREQSVIVARDAIEDNQDLLKNAINMEFDPENEHKKIKPLDRPQLTSDYKQFQMPQAIEEAMVRRPDYLSKKKELDSKNIEVRFNKNQLYPSLDLVATLGLNGLAGDAVSIQQFGGGTIQSEFGGGYGENLKNTFDPDFYSWEVGLKLEYPLGNRSAKSKLKRSQFEAEQLILDLKNLERTIVVEVREAIRQLNTDAKRVHAAQLAVKFAEEKLAAEEKKFKVGLSTSFQVLEFQEDLAVEQSKQIQTLVDYNKSIIRLRQVMATTLEHYNIKMAAKKE